MPAETDPISFLRQDQKRVAVCFGQCSGWLTNHLSRGISAMKFWHSSSKKGFCTSQSNPSPQDSPLEVYAYPQSALPCPRLRWRGACDAVGTSPSVAMAAGVMSPALGAVRSTVWALLALTSAAGRTKPIHWLPSLHSGR